MLAAVLMVPDIVVGVNDTSPAALMANVPLHAMAKLNVFPE